MARVGTHRAAPPSVLGDATAQELDVVAASAARLSESGFAGFWEGAGGERRGWVMQLPTGAGHDVLALFLQGLPGLTVTPQSQRFRTAHERLDSLVAERWRLEFKTLLGAVAPHAQREEHWPKEAGHQAMATAYKNIWDKQLQAEKKAAEQDKDPNRHPGRDWRLGRVRGAIPPDELEVGRPSNQRMKTQTQRAVGEKWPNPGHTGELRPGVSASVIHPAGAPHPGFTSGGFCVEGPQPWMPLARRVCLDRVLHVMLEATSLFASARAEGSTGDSNNTKTQ